MRYIIWGARGTGSGIVEAACAELGVEYEARDLDARNDEHRGGAYRAVNPHGKMPALQAGDEVITESVAILLALDERHREGGLLPPPGSRERAQALRWMLYLATEIYPLVEWDDYPERLAPAPDGAEALRERARSITRERWRLLEGQIAGPYLLASGFTATDLYLTKLAVWQPEAFRRAELPKVQALVDTVRARPKLEQVWARHLR